MIPKYLYIYICIQILYILFFLKKILNFKIGPYEYFSLYGYLINSWKKWFLIMTILVIKNVILDYFLKLYKNWHHYEIEEKYTKDEKKWNKNSIKELIIINIVSIFEWIYSLVEYILFIESSDLQIFLPELISKYIISNNYFHYNLMKNKF